MHRKLLAALALVCLPGCASVSVRNAALRNEPASPPARIYVMNFDARDAVFRVNEKDPAKIAAAKARAADSLSDTLVKRLDKSVAPALRVPAGRVRATDGWLLTGRFDRVNSGSATLRILFGTGLGGSKMNTTVFLYNLRGRARGKKPFLTFTTTGGSGAVPGLITIPLGGPVATPMLIYDVASKVYGEENHGVKDDAARTARMVAAAVSEYMARRGFPLKAGEMKPKRNLSDSLVRPL